MKRTLSLAIGFVALAAIPAVAADLPVKAPVVAPVVAPVAMWTGFYIGGHAGYGWGRAGISHSPLFPTIGGGGAFAIDLAAVQAASSPSLKPNGFTGGVHVGYNYQSGAFVGGLEADFSYFKLRRSTTGTFPFPSTLPGGPLGPPTLTFTSTTSFETDWLFTLRPRIGVVAANSVLLYVTGGLAVTNEKVAQVTGVLNAATFPSAINATRAGWTVGGGVEYAMSRNWSLRAEYLHLDFGTVSGAGTSTAPAGIVGNAGCTPTTPVATGPFTLPGCSISARLTAEVARVGLTYRFDAGPVVARY